MTEKQWRKRFHQRVREYREGNHETSLYGTGTPSNLTQFLRNQESLIAAMPTTTSNIPLCDALEAKRQEFSERRQRILAFREGRLAAYVVQARKQQLPDPAVAPPPSEWPDVRPAQPPKDAPVAESPEQARAFGYAAYKGADASLNWREFAEESATNWGLTDEELTPNVVAYLELLSQDLEHYALRAVFAETREREKAATIEALQTFLRNRDDELESARIREKSLAATIVNRDDQIDILKKVVDAYHSLQRELREKEDRLAALSQQIAEERYQAASECKRQEVDWEAARKELDLLKLERDDWKQQHAALARALASYTRSVAQDGKEALDASYKRSNATEHVAQVESAHAFADPFDSAMGYDENDDDKLDEFELADAAAKMRPTAATVPAPLLVCTQFRETQWVGKCDPDALPLVECYDVVFVAANEEVKCQVYARNLLDAAWYAATLGEVLRVEVVNQACRTIITGRALQEMQRAASVTAVQV